VKILGLNLVMMPSYPTLIIRHSKLLKHLYIFTSSSAIAERPRDAWVTSIRKIAKWNFWATLLRGLGET